MEPISWSVIAGLVVQYGLPFATKVVQKWESGASVTTADMDELRGLAKQKAVDVMSQQLAAAGIPLDDPKAVAMLALAK